jgi:hypothetical protein
MGSPLFTLAFVAVLLSLAPALAAEGNVTAFVDRNGVLVVIGDELDNRVVVGRTGIPDEFVVRGEVFTTVNGTNEVVLGANDVKIFMRGGNDEARVDGSVPGFVHVEGGSGNDRLSLGDPVVHGTALLDGGEGDDHLGMEGAEAKAGLRLIGGKGNDDVQLVFAVVEQELVIDLGEGDDLLDVSNFTARGSFRFDGGAGSDDVLIQDSTVSSDTVLVLAAGNDDVVGQRNSFGGRFQVSLGLQDDALTLTQTTVAGRAAFYAASGTDTYTDLGDNDFQSGTPTVAGFEVLADSL